MNNLFLQLTDATVLSYTNNRKICKINFNQIHSCISLKIKECRKFYKIRTVLYLSMTFLLLTNYSHGILEMQYWSREGNGKHTNK